MPIQIPSQYNGNMYLWFNDVVGRLNNQNGLVSFYTTIWGRLSTQGKADAKAEVLGAMDTAIAEAQQIRQWINENV